MFFEVLTYVSPCIFALFWLWSVNRANVLASAAVDAEICVDNISCISL